MEIKVYKDLMGENAEWAAKTREVLKKEGILMLNLIGSPGCGKTALLEKVIPCLARAGKQVAVLEGDVETTRDAERLAVHGIMASQLLTGGACHLEAKLVHYALKDLPLESLDIVIVENVGNMVCPAEFDIGEHAKVAVLSVTEGEDKPLKYPLLFKESKAAIVTKIDLLPHLDFDLKKCVTFMRQVNPALNIMQVSSKTGEGVEALCKWVGERSVSM